MDDDEYDALLASQPDADPFNPYFDRQGRQLRDVLEWAKLLESPGYKRIALTTLRGIRVSTIWTGLDAGWAEDGAPTQIFETMTFAQRRRDRHKIWAINRLTVRYATEGEAVKGHERVVGQIKARGTSAIWSYRKEREWQEAWGSLYRAGLFRPT